MRCLPLLIGSLCAQLFVAGCAATPKPGPPAMSDVERQALLRARQQRLEASMRTRWGLPDDVQAMLARKAAPAVPEKIAPSPPPLPPITRPSSIPGVRRMRIVGDSFAVGIGMTMSGQIKGMGVRLAEKGKVSSGLNSPHFYNWEEKLPEFMASEHPDVLVAMVSGNDAHNGSGSSSWKTAYEERVARFIDLATTAGVAVYMVGLPPMGKPDYSQRAYVANQAVRRVCEQSEGCRYVDTWRIFSDEQGDYIQVKQFKGEPVTLRAKDGVHFTMNGYKILSAAILERIADTYARTAME